MMAKKPAKRWTAKDAERALGQWKASGLSMAEYGRRHGIHPKRLYGWRDRLASRPGEAEAITSDEGQQFVEATICGTESDAAVVLKRGALRIEVHDPSRTTAAWLAALLSTLSSQR
jgi:transposase-like protein